jgi:hypothetical protein
MQRHPVLTSFQKIKEIHISEVQTLFKDMVDNELAVIGLFLKSIVSIELRVIHPGGRIQLVGQVKIEEAGGPLGSRSFTRGSEAREATFKCRVVTSGSNGHSTSVTWRIFHSVLDASETSSIMSKRLPNHSDVGDQLKEDKLFAHTALAFPLDVPRIKGRLFTLLPLPIFTDFPMHLHGILALTPDRQSLRNREETGLSLASREKLRLS